MTERLPDQAEISAETKRARLARRLQPPADGTMESPLASAQERLWFLQQIDGDSTAYHISRVFFITGPLDVNALQESLAVVVRRHECLRTRIVNREGQPRQVILPALPVKLPVHELPDATASDSPASRRATVLHVAAAASHQPFDLTHAPLWRARLWRLDAQTHVLLLVVHHIITDGWSMAVLLDELGASYRALAAQTPATLPALVAHYSDFVRWERRRMRDPALAAELDHWTARLAGAPVLELPGDRPRPAVSSQRGAVRTFHLDADLVAALRTFQQVHQVTPYMTALAAWFVLMQRLAHQDDVVVGSPVANRADPRLANVFGFMANTVVLRADLRQNPTVRELMHQVRNLVLDAMSHQELPFEKLVEALQPERSLSHTPLFQVMFAYQTTSLPMFDLPGLTVEAVRLHAARARFDLTLEMWEETGTIHGALEYSTDLFDADTVQRWLHHYRVLLHAMITQPSRRILDLPLLTAAERQQLLTTWNATTTAYPRSQGIAALFAEQVARRPEAVALVMGEATMSYRELDHRAKQVARQLQRLGVGPDVLVGVCVERSAAMIVAVLGILKAGGAYLPLDPAYPEARVQFMLDDTGAPVVVTTEALRSLLPGYTGKIVALDTLPIGADDGEVCAIVDPEHLAYVMYTSGSTGKPKGVAVTQRNVVRLVRATNYAHFSPEEVFLQLAPLAFDASTLEIWGALLNGARLVIYPPGVPTLSDLALTLRRHGVSLLWLTSGLFQQMVDEQVEALAQVRQVLAGGDVLPAAHARQFLAQPGVGRLINGYGPTETTTFACCHPMTPVDPIGSTVAIGRPIANARVYVVDRNGQPVPVGVPGELLIGGDGLARGYLGRPGLTAERFLPDPFGNQPGARLYRTGDLVRCLADGRIEFLGRLDNQVKLRGFRIEPGEIEARLNQHAEVHESTVIIREDTPGDKRLVAYVVAADGLTPSAPDLRTFLKQTLPDYMVPATFVSLPALPLTPNGKIDRQALPLPDRLTAADLPAAPRNPIEEIVAGIWADILHQPQVGVFDNFFDLGGHSLLATQVVSRLRRTFKQDIPLRLFFEAPTVAELAAHLVTLNSEAGTSPLLPPVTPGGQLDQAPLSFSQERQWFLDQLEPGTAAYNVPLAYRVHGRLDEAVLAHALAEVVQRHAVLRTTFPAVDGQPRQTVHPPTAVTFVDVLPAALVRLDARVPTYALVDLAHLPAASRFETAVGLAQQEAQRPFDLAHGPLLRVVLWRLDAHDHLLLLNLHHIVCDGWSVGVLWRELLGLYRAFAMAEPSPLPELPVQYVDFAAWQRRWLESAEMAHQLDYWRQQLRDVPALQLPTDRPCPAVQTYRSAVVRQHLPAHLLPQVKALGQHSGATLFMTLLAAFDILLYRTSGQDDFCVGSFVANRNRAETEGLIGFFVNNLALRTALAGRPTVHELLGRVRDVTLAAYAHQDVPFEQVLNAVQPERTLSHPPLFQVMCVLQNFPMPDQDPSGLQISLVEMEMTKSDFELTLWMREETGRLLLKWQYNPDLFDRTTIERLSSHYTHLLQAMVTQPEQRIDRLPLLTPAERRQLLVDWNPATPRLDASPLVHEAFSQQAQRTPQAIAVSDGTHQLTYAALDALAGHVASHLQSLGAGPGDLIAILMEKTVDVVAAMLGTWKAGAAYLPLDPTYPADRLAMMLADGDVRLVITQPALEDHLPAHRAQVVYLDASTWPALAARPAVPVTAPATADHLAYVIYTSGSTGRPKGVMVSHRSLASYLAAIRPPLAFGPNDRVLQFASISFDAMVEELWVPLLCGSAVHLRPASIMAPGPEFNQLIDTYTLTVLSLPTAFWHEWVFELARSGGTVPPTVRLVLTNAEEPLPERYQLWRARSGDRAQWINTYGPTEGTVTATLFDPAAQPDPHRAWARLPIGRPLANTALYVLDRHLEPVPVGVPGELYLGGGGITQGYLRRPGLTAATFVPDPFSQEPGARLYRTGDLVRYLADGNVEFLGRVDTQVKIRGYRVELGEIETVLARHPAVQESAVIVREDAPGQKRLVAYVVAQPQHTQPAAGIPSLLRTYLLEQLPNYMVPAVFVLIESLPRSSNGKIDRRNLPVPDVAAAGGTAVTPRTPLEEIIAGIWAEVLRVPTVGVQDNFFDLGGHSLLATQVISRIRASTGRELPLRTLFERPTVAELTQVVMDGWRGEGMASAPKVSRVVDAEAPLSFGQERLWFLEQLTPGMTAYNITTALRLAGELAVEALAWGLTEVVRRHAVLRTRFELRGGAPVQVTAPPGDVELPLIDLTALGEAGAEAAMQAWVQTEAGRPFDLAAGPLLRVALLRLGVEVHVLVLAMHHTVSDGWSLGVLLRELEALYGARLRGEGSPLGELGIQYADYAVWQRGWLAGEALAAQMAYWKGQLGGELPVLELPGDRARPAVPSYRGGVVRAALPEELVAELHGLSREAGTTLFMTLLAGFEMLLHRYTGQSDLIVGTPIAGRGRSELEPLIGLFVNTLALRCDVGGDPTFRQLLGRVRQVTLEAYAHQDVPFEKLVAELQPTRDVSHNPIFQVMLSLQNVPQATRHWPGVTLDALPVSTGAAQFDLNLVLWTLSSGVQAALEYSTDLFDAATAERLLGHYVQLLTSVVADPDQRITEVALLSAAERRQVVDGWNATAQAYTGAGSIHELFTAQAAATPHAVAVVSEERTLTYEALARRTNQLARFLRRLGVGREVRVGICLERRAALVEAIYGTWKAGGAYVALEPSYPAERLGYMAANSQVALVLTQTTLLEKLAQLGVPLVNVDTAWEAIGRESDAAWDEEALGAQAAYVIYTSGSTGQPKGVLNTHAALRNRILWMQAAYGLGTEDAVLQKTPYGFDVSVWEFCWPLVVGARLVMARPEGHKDSGYLVEVIQGEGVTTLHFVPSMLGVFVDEPGLSDCQSLRRVICSGEALSYELQARFMARHAAALINLYGPTEAAIDVTAWICEPESEARVVPIGRPIANVQVYVLGARMQPVPVGVPGELYIGGMALARGYVGQAGLTAERFVPDPFDRAGGGRLYRTGDLVRQRADGRIEYLGRRDFQVKLRGFRIELGEIEASLRGQAGVREAVVVVREDVPGQKRLVAYVVPAEGILPQEAALRDALHGRLPEYMVPGTFVILERLPLTPSGKIDRRSLPAPSLPTIAEGPEADVPTSPLEVLLANIWARVLRLARVGRLDNFFTLGGDSILGMQMISRAREAGLRLTPLQLFQHQTVAELAAVTAVDSPAAFDQGDLTGSVPLTPIQHWFFEEPRHGAHHFNQAVVLDATPRIEPALLSRALRTLLRHHDALRLRFDRDDSGVHQWYAEPGDAVPLHVEDLSSLSPAEQAAAFESRAGVAQASLDLTNGPLVRMVLFERGDGQTQRLLIVIHHLAVDGVSWRILLEDLETVYHQLARDQAPRLPAKTTSYRRWATRLREHAQSPAVQNELAYWNRSVWQRTAPLPLDEPFDPAANTVDRAAHHVVELTPAETQALLTEVPAAYQAQMNEVLLMAIVQVMTRWTGARVLRVDVESHGREMIAPDIDLSRTVGWFTALYPLSIDLPATTDPGELLKAVKEQVRQVPQRGTGYGLLRYLADDAAVRRQLAAQPAAPLIVNYLGQFDQTLADSGLFRPARTTAGPARDPGDRRLYLLEVDAAVSGGRLVTTWTYSQVLHRTATIAHLAAETQDALRALIEHCRMPGAGGFTPADFTAAHVKQSDLDKLAARIGRGDRRSTR